MIEKMKKLWLKYIVGYNDPEHYWNQRWKFQLSAELKTETEGLKLMNKIYKLMEKHHCSNILEIGCGRAALRGLPNYTGLDFSIEALNQSRLKHFIHADIAEKIPLADNSQDAVLSRFVLLHIPNSRINDAVKEICRVAGKLIILQEPWDTKPKNLQPHCFCHNLPELFANHFEGETVFLN